MAKGRKPARSDDQIDREMRALVRIILRNLSQMGARGGQGGDWDYLNVDDFSGRSDFVNQMRSGDQLASVYEAAGRPAFGTKQASAYFAANDQNLKDVYDYLARRQGANKRRIGPR